MVMSMVENGKKCWGTEVTNALSINGFFNCVWLLQGVGNEKTVLSELK